MAYITPEQEQLLIAKTDEPGRILNGLITSIQRKKSKPPALTPSP